jgi:transposase
MHLDHITLLDWLAAEIEDEIEAAVGAIPAAWGVSADGVPSPDPGPDAAVLPAAERLAEIPGVSLKLAREIIAETGLDMTRFPTADLGRTGTGRPAVRPAAAQAVQGTG